MAERQTSDARRASRWPTRVHLATSRDRDYRVDGGSAVPPSGSVSTALGPRPPPLPFLDFDGSLAVSETSSRAAARCGAPRPARISLQRALGDGELDALALQARIEFIDAPFGLGPIGSGVDLDFGDAVGQRLYLLLGVGERGLARLQRLRQDVRPFRQRRPPLLELADLAVKPIARRGEPLDDLIRGVASDGPFHHLALQDPDVLGARAERLAHLGEQFLRGGGARTQRLE